ncbi:MAG: 30S ribosomal protein S17 [Acidimicrobiales bacterium]|nr:30S ribosomal protein S17 [Acidimicrobiales bacterium]
MAEETATQAAPRNNRKVREGVVHSNKMDKTAIVEVTRRSRHPQYSKTVQSRARYYVHDEDNTLNVGDRVRITETRPLSKNKRWRLLEILERAR